MAFDKRNYKYIFRIAIGIYCVQGYLKILVKAANKM